MQKLSTEILTEEGGKKIISVWIDEETAKLLDNYADEKIKHEYIVEEYKARLIERRETRRHQSLEESFTLGYEFADPNADIEQYLENQEEKKELLRSLKVLTDKQFFILKLHVLKRKSFREISEMLGLNQCTVKEHFYTAKKKLEKFFK